MTRVTHCQHCGKLLALLNNTSRCYRNCIRSSMPLPPYVKKSEDVDAVKKNSESHDDIVAVVCTHFNVPLSSMYGKTPQRHFIKPRDIIIYLLLADLKYTAQKAGSILHLTESTVLRKHSKIADTYHLYGADLDAIRKTLAHKFLKTQT